MNKLKLLSIIIMIYSINTSNANYPSSNHAGDFATGINAMSNGISSVIQTFGGLIERGKDQFDKTADHVNSKSDNQILQNCNIQLQHLQQENNELNNKYSIIYEYVANKLQEILAKASQSPVEMYNAINQLWSIWNAITKLSTAEQVSQFLISHNQFYASMDKYKYNSQINTQNLQLNNTQNAHYNSEISVNNANRLNNTQYSANNTLWNTAHYNTNYLGSINSQQPQHNASNNALWKEIPIQKQSIRWQTLRR